MPGDSERVVEGVVVEALPSALYLVEIDGRRRITAHIAGRESGAGQEKGGGVDRNFIRVLVGDRVNVALTARDLTRGRILKKVL
jgi:translation initiation factor IF-1